MISVGKLVGLVSSVVEEFLVAVLREENLLGNSVTFFLRLGRDFIIRMGTRGKRTGFVIEDVISWGTTRGVKKMNLKNTKTQGSCIRRHQIKHNKYKLPFCVYMYICHTMMFSVTSDVSI